MQEHSGACSKSPVAVTAWEEKEVKKREQRRARERERGRGNGMEMCDERYKEREADNLCQTAVSVLPCVCVWACVAIGIVTVKL